MESFKDRQNQSLKVSAIVPFYNEEKTIGKVVEVLLNSPLIDEIICVNDGSEDKSLRRIKKFNHQIKILDYKKNHGKGFALASGIKQASGEIVAFFDADLKNLSQKHIKNLLNPILNNSECRVVIGYPKDEKYVWYFFKSLTGERAYWRKDLLPYLARISQAGYGVEILLNELFFGKAKDIALKDLRGLTKLEKVGYQKGIRGYLLEAAEIAQEIGRKELISTRQYQKIKHLLKSKTFKELKSRIEKIGNKRVESVLKKFINHYAKILKENFKNFLADF